MQNFLTEPPQWGSNYYIWMVNFSTGPKTQTDTLPPTGGDTILTNHVTPDMEVDIEGYRKYVIELILELKAQGMILKDIKAELEGIGLKTFTGKKIWSAGTIGKLWV